jgi:hypothetical protein
MQVGQKCPIVKRGTPGTAAEWPLPAASPLDTALPEWMAEEGEPVSRLLAPTELPRRAARSGPAQPALHVRSRPGPHGPGRFFV